MRTTLFQSIRKCFHALLVIALVVLTTKSANAQITFDIEGATATYVTGINSDTDICGYATFPNGEVEGFIFKDGDTTLVQYLTTNTWFGGINDNGLIVGRYNATGNAFDYNVFVYNIATGEFVQIHDLDGYENTMPNDISNNGWISGDLKSGVQRRIFTYHPDNGLATNFKSVAGTPMPTYGGNQVDDLGKTTAYWIDGAQQMSTFYITSTSSFETETISFTDGSINEGNNSIYKTQLVANGFGIGIVRFVQSKSSWSYDLLMDTLMDKLMIPHAMYISIDCMNAENYLAGNYTDSSGVIHGYFQTKIAVDFDPVQECWAFQNNSDIFWNEEDYFTIGYHKDPYWYDTYFENIDFPRAPDFMTFPSNSAFSWSEWVQVFGEDQMYVQDPNINYVEQNPNSMAAWIKFREDDPGGVCWGMTSNALLVRDHFSTFQELYPNMGSLLEVYTPGTVSSNEAEYTVIPAARTSQILAYSKKGTELMMSTNDTPEDIVKELFRVFSDDPDHLNSIGLTIYSSQHERIGGHSVIPYKIERNPLEINIYHIGIYDPNYPLNPNTIMKLEMQDQYSYYKYHRYDDLWTPWTFSGLKYENYFNAFDLNPEVVHMNGFLGSRDGNVNISFLNNPDIHIVNGTGQELIVTDEAVENDYDPSAIMDYPTGHEQKPRHFYLTDDNYDIEVTSTSDAPFSAWLTDGLGTIVYSKAESANEELNLLSMEDGVFTYTGNNQSGSSIDAYILTSDETIQYQYFVDDINVSSGQSIGLRIIDATHIMITSNGAATDYDVRIRIYSPETGFWEAVASNVPIGTNVTQLIIPSLTEDTMDGIIIETDANQDGTYEGSEGFDNEGVPNMMLSIAEVEIANTGGTESFHVSNVGAGNLNWNVIYAPSWITVNTGATGVNHGPIEFTVAENTTSAGRQDYLIVEASTPANDQDTVLVIQGEGGVIAIDNIRMNGSTVSIMPNPANDRVQFAVEHNFVGNASYTIYSSTGQLVREGQMRGQKEILNTSQMERGVYQVKFNLNGKTIIKKLVLS